MQVITPVITIIVSTHMPLARHDAYIRKDGAKFVVSTHMPLARHDFPRKGGSGKFFSFYSHASCEA